MFAEVMTAGVARRGKGTARRARGSGDPRHGEPRVARAQVPEYAPPPKTEPRKEAAARLPLACRQTPLASPVAKASLTGAFVGTSPPPAALHSRLHFPCG